MVEVPALARKRVELLQQASELAAEVLEELAADGDGRVRFWLARRPELTVELIDRLRADPEVSVRRSLILNPVAPLLEPAEQLAVDADVVVRRCLARRAGLEASVLDVLARDVDGVVRSFVARHRGLTEPLARLLAADDEWGVRANLALQRGRWVWLDDRLEDDPDDCVRQLFQEAESSQPPNWPV